MRGMKQPEEEGPTRYLTGGVLIDGSGARPVKGPVIVLQGRSIGQVGARKSIRVPAEAAETIEEAVV